MLIEGSDTTVTPVRLTGALWLYDGVGTILVDRLESGIHGFKFLALTPNGAAVYQRGNEYQFVPLAPIGTRFGDDPVSLPLPEPLQPMYFFASQ